MRDWTLITDILGYEVVISNLEKIVKLKKELFLHCNEEEEMLRSIKKRQLDDFWSGWRDYEGQ